MRTSSQTLEENKLKLTIEVDEEEVKRAEDETFRRLTREAQVPGFRPGHVPRRILAARLGRKAVRQEVLRDSLPQYLSDALDESELDVISTPEIEVTSGEESGPLVFDAVVELRPKVAIPGYDGLVVTLENPEATEEEINAQVDRMRDQFATLTEVERPARDGDLVTIDVHGTRDGKAAEGLSVDDLVYEVGTGGIVEGIDERLRGAKVGDIFEMDAEDAPDGPAHLHVLVKQVREKELPAADDAFAKDASEFESIAELRSDLANRLSVTKKLRGTMAIRELAVEALAELVIDDPPESLVASETQRILDDFVHRLSHEQMTLDRYLAATAQTPDSFFAGLQEQAAKLVRADLALRALIEAESLEVDESDVDDEIAITAQQGQQDPAELRRALEETGRMPGVRQQLRTAKAIDWLVEHVAIVDPEGKPIDRAALRGAPVATENDDHDHDHDHEGHDHADHDHGAEAMKEEA